MKHDWRGALGVAAMAVTLGPGAQSQALPDNIPDEADDLSISSTLPAISLPTPLVFGDARQFCLPGDASCALPTIPPSANQPAGVLIGQINVGTCALRIKLGNVALRGWASNGGGFRPAQLAVRGYATSYVPSFATDRVYFSVVSEVIAEPVDMVACRTVRQEDLAFDLGQIRWTGNVGSVGFGAATPISSLSQVGAPPDPKAFTLTWIGRTVRVRGGMDCGAPMLESGIYEARSATPVVLFPTLSSAVTTSVASPVATTHCLPVSG